MLLNFKEIPQANLGGGNQDTFELFCRDFLEILGYKIVQHPYRGADGKKDLIVQEARVGLSGTTLLRWLVSCKHHAHSGKSVSDTDELNIFDRISINCCNGFIGFYSTLPATSLAANFEGLKKKTEIQYFDKEQIEKILLETSQGLKLANRYFPVSYSSYIRENPIPAKIFSNDLTINCEYCNTNLLEKRSGILVLLRKPSNFEIEFYKRNPTIEAYFSCKGRCDDILRNRYFQNERFIDEWTDISDFLSPIGFIKKVMAWLNSFQSSTYQIDTKAFEKVKQLLLSSFQYISREMTTEEKIKVKDYLETGLTDYL